MSHSADPDRSPEEANSLSRLNTVVEFLTRFSVNPHVWQRWVFDQLDLPPTSRILELGCGTGNLWQTNLDRLPKSWQIILSDPSPDMLHAAQAQLGTSQHAWQFKLVDAQQIPLDTASLDAVIAVFVLWVVPDRERAYQEIRRVLRPGGQLFAATAGEANNREMKELVNRFNPTLGRTWTELPFKLETGEAELRHWFDHVEIRRHPDELIITEAEPFADFILLNFDQAYQATIAAQRPALIAFLEHELAQHGLLHVTKDRGMFVARRGAS